MRIVSVIIKVTNRNKNLLKILNELKLVSMSYRKGCVIIGRHGTNKATLMRIIRREVE
jgi:ABC-type polysaccharide/polyol phosphate transport system ATPase subunit